MQPKFPIGQKVEFDDNVLKVTEINQYKGEPTYTVTGEYNHWLGEDGFLAPLTYELTQEEIAECVI